MVDSVFLVLLVVHVGSIVAWMGGAALFISVISPSLGKMSPSSRAEFILSALPRYMRFVGGSAVVAVIAGLLLYGYTTQVATSLAPSSSGLIYIQAGAGLGLVVLIIAFGVMIPSGRKLVSLVGQMSKTQPTPPTEGSTAVRVATLQKRLAMAGRLGVTLLAFALILMVIGAILP